MGKLTKAPEEVQELIREISSELRLEMYGVDFEAVYVEGQKDAVVIKKASKVAEYLTNRDDLVLVMLNEKLFEADVESKVKYMWLRMAIDTVSYDTERDRLVIGCPMINIPVGFYEKYKTAAVESALLAHYTLKQIEDQEKQRKAEEAAQKKASRKKKNF